jgi:hypothetical protein
VAARRRSIAPDIRKREPRELPVKDCAISVAILDWQRLRQLNFRLACVLEPLLRKDRAGALLIHELQLAPAAMYCVLAVLTFRERKTKPKSN